MTHGINKIFLLLILCILSAGATRDLRSAQPGSLPGSSRFPHDCNPTAITDQDIQNFHLVDADLYRGGRPANREEVYRKLAELGVRTVVNLETTEVETERAQIDRLNQGRSEQIQFISFRINPFPEVLLTGIPDKGDKGIICLFKRLQDAPKPVFVHCREGKDRTGTVVLLYRIKRKEVTFEVARKEALWYGFNERWDRGLNKTIERYQGGRLADLPDPDPSASSPPGVCIGGSSAAP
jgi:protein tyrosine/serine phosphatase